MTTKKPKFEEPQEEPQPQEEVTKHTIEFDDETKIASFVTEDGLEVQVRCPKTKQMLKVRKLVRRHGEEEDQGDEEFTLRMFSLACVVKYGESKSMSFEEYEELSIVDSTLLAKCLEFFRSEFEALSKSV